MAVRPIGALALALAVAAVSPGAAEDRFEIPLGQLQLRPGAGPKLSLGSVGLDSRAGNSYRPAPGDDPYPFVIPGQRPFKKVPGFLLKIPFGINRSG